MKFLLITTLLFAALLAQAYWQQEDMAAELEETRAQLADALLDNERLDAKLMTCREVVGQLRRGEID